LSINDSLASKKITYTYLTNQTELTIEIYLFVIKQKFKMYLSKEEITPELLINVYIKRKKEIENKIKRGSTTSA
jgi:hypothetical protein